MNELNELSLLAKEFFGFGDSPREIGVVLPSVPHKRRVSLQCMNYPLFSYAISYDDALSAFRIHSLLSGLYGDRVRVFSREQLTAGKPIQDLVLIGGPPTNPFTFDLAKKAVIQFGEKDDTTDRTIVGRRGIYRIEFDSDERKARNLTRDYCLISKTRLHGTTEWVVAGLRAYGQLASAGFLGTPDFYLRCKKLGLPAMDEFQLVVRVEVSGRACSTWTIVDWFPSRAAICDVFICYNSANRQAVMAIACALINCGIVPWLDEWELHPGDAWSDALTAQILKCRSAAVFIGAEEFGKWQRLEYNVLLNQLIQRNDRIVPVLLPGSTGPSALPMTLNPFHAADFRNGSDQAIRQLADAIRPDRE